MRIKLPIFYNTKETDHLSEGGIDADLSKCEVRQVVFYRIDSIAQYFKEYRPTNCTLIASGDTRFICALPVEEVDKLVTKEMMIYS